MYHHGIFNFVLGYSCPLQQLTYILRARLVHTIFSSIRKTFLNVDFFSNIRTLKLYHIRKILAYFYIIFHYDFAM